MDWPELSAKVFGLIWTEQRLASAFSADDFHPPYDDAVKILQQKGASREDVLREINDRFINSAVESVSHLTEVAGDLGYDSALIKAAQSFRLSQKFTKAASKLKANESFDMLSLYGEMTSVVSGQATGLTLSTQIDYKTYKPFIKCGWPIIDKVIGGIPADGPIIVYGPTGVGKSHWAEKMTMHLLQTYKTWTAGIYTLEMSAEHYLNRTMKMYPDIEKCLDRLFISGSVHNIEELVAEITLKRVNFVVIDDMDGLVEEESPAAYQRVYKRVKEICRFLKIPVIDLAQPNRAAKLAGRFMRPYDISWSGAGENAAAMQIALQKASSFDMEDSNDELFVTTDEEMYYMIFWKSRDDWPAQQGPGAIILQKNHGMWQGKPYADKEKLWTPGSGKTVGKSIKRRSRHAS